MSTNSKSFNWEPVIGLEIHVQLSTKSKIFSNAPTEFGIEQNLQASIIDLGLPGVLPVLNKKAIEMAVRFGCSINANISNHAIFARKNYFYPDLPKGYQISQLDDPIVREGLRKFLEADNGCQVVAEASDGSAALFASENHDHDILLMNATLPGSDVFEIIRTLKQSHNSSKIIVCYVPEDISIGRSLVL